VFSEGIVLNKEKNYVAFAKPVALCALRYSLEHRPNGDGGDERQCEGVSRWCSIALGKIVTSTSSNKRVCDHNIRHDSDHETKYGNEPSMALRHPKVRRSVGMWQWRLSPFKTISCKYSPISPWNRSSYVERRDVCMTTVVVRVDYLKSKCQV
jgi:hypothetical protein